MNELMTIASGRPFGRRHHTSGGWYDHRENLLWLGEARHNSSIVLHELIHFFEHCATPYGLLRDELQLRKQICTTEFLKQFDGTVFVPVYQWAHQFRKQRSGQPLSSNHRHFDNLISNFVSPWGNCAFLENVLDGCDDSVVRSANTDTTFDVLDRCELDLATSLNISTSAVSASPRASQTQSSCCPTVSIEDDGVTHHFPFGGLHLSEGIAQMLEGFGGRGTSGLALAYRAVPLIGIVCFSKAHPDLLETSGSRIGITCLALADLALFTPIGAVYGRLRSNESTWEDMHPGHRFLRALHVVAESDLWIETLDDAMNLDDELCKRFAWPAPIEFLRMGAGLESPHLVVQRHRAACIIRLAEFAAFYDKARITDQDGPIPAFFSRFMPMTFHPEYGTLCGVPDDPEGMTNPIVQIRDSYYARLAFNVMFSQSWNDSLPPHVRFDLYFENIHNTLGLEKLIEEFHPWARRSRFCPLETPVN
jgi:hypothetical protein